MKLRVPFIRNGFTLIEVIVFLVLLGIFSTFLITYVQTASENSVVGVDWLRNETRLQSMMEDVVAGYKEMISDKAADAVSETDDLETLKSYAESAYGSYVLGSETGYVYFDADGDSTWPPQSTIQAQDPVLIVTLQVGDQTASSMFMATE